MAQTDDRVNLIGAAILSQAQQEARAIIDKANAIREQEIDIAKEAMIDKMFGKVQEKATNIRLESVKAIARVDLEAHSELLKLRGSKTDTVFQNVTGRLWQYARTDACKAEMLEKAEKLQDAYDHSATEILVRECDRELGTAIAEAIGGGAVKVDPSIKIGGFKLKNEKARVLLDETLDERLSEQRAWFLKTCGLKVH